MSLVCTMHNIGYINDVDKNNLLYEISVGNTEAYAKVKQLLIEMAEEIGKV